MPRVYRHIQEYEKEILELREQGKPDREIRERFEFIKKQYENFITRYNHRQNQIAAGIAIKNKGKPAKDTVCSKVFMFFNRSAMRPYSFHIPSP